MKNNKENLHNNSFEQLLKQSLLENGNDKFNQKIMDMNASYIFEKPMATAINMRTINSLINKHLSKSIPLLILNYTIKYVLPILLIALIILDYTSTNVNSNNYNNNSIIPIVSGDNSPTDTTRTIENSIENKILPITNKPTNNTITAQKNNTDTIIPITLDTLFLKDQFKSKVSYTSGGGGGMPSYMKNYEYPDLYVAPAPIFDELELNNEYILSGKVYDISQFYPFDIKNRYNYVTYYKNEPFLKGMDDFVYINYAEQINNRKGTSTLSQRNDTRNINFNNYLVPPFSLKSYLNDYKVNNEGQFIINKLTKKQLNLITSPYYFSKYEVNNEEYKQFTDWVLKSNGYDSLPYSLVIDKNAHYYGYPQYDSTKYSNMKPYIVKWNINKHKAYKYTFFNPTKHILREIQGNTICISPKDTIDVKYLSGFYMPYEINPFYQYNEDNKNKAITGVSYYQALAFLDWKTHFHQQKFDNSNVNIEITYVLPNIIERRLAVPFFNDNNWLTDLYTKKHRKSHLDNTINNYLSYNYHPKNFTLQQVSNKNKTYSKDDYKLFSTEDGIMWLDGNVSEWVEANYTDNWGKPYTAHKKHLSKTDAGNISTIIEEHFNKQNNKNGKLIMGGNFIDYRKGFVSCENFYSLNKDEITINKPGIYLKKFVNPHKQYSTVGFRYIIKIEDVAEKQKTELLELIGSFDYNKYKDFPEKHIETFKEFDKNKFILNQEVTNGMWRSFLLDLLKTRQKSKALKCIPKSELWAKYNEEYIYYFKDLKYDELPVTNISHEAATIFNKWLTIKFNNYPLRKFALVEFNLPTEKEWVLAAQGNLLDSEYPWGGPYSKNYKDFKLANFKLNQYHVPYYLGEGKGISKQEADSINNLSSTEKLEKLYNEFPDSIRIAHLEKYEKSEISYQQFKKLDDEYWNKTKTRARLYNMKDFADPNEFELYNMCGNVAEMIDTPTKTKGGSWNSYDTQSQIPQHEPWNGKPSPMVGFRPIMKVTNSNNYGKTKGLKSKIPPGTILINKYYGVDKFEITNLDYKEFLHYTKKSYGFNSKEYTEILPDTNCWVDSNLFEKPYYMEPYKEKYLSHPAYHHYPVVGVSYKQVAKYCKWRSKIVTDNYAIYNAKHPDSKDIPKKVTYRLPTPEEWEKLAKEKKYYVKSNEKLTKSSVKAENSKYKNSFGTSLVKSLSKNKIGIYGLNTNVSEMTSKKGVAKGGNWHQKHVKQRKELTYTKPESWLGFRCVVNIEY